MWLSGKWKRGKKGASVFQPYVHELPSDSVLAVVSILRNNEVVSRRREFAKHLHQIESYALYVLVGEPGETAEMAAVDQQEVAELNATNTTTRLDYLEQYAKASSDGTQAALPVGLSLLLKWVVQYALVKLLENIGK